MRHAIVGVIMALAGVGGTAATPSDVAPELAPWQGEAQAEPKALTAVPDLESVQRGSEPQSDATKQSSKLPPGPPRSVTAGQATPQPTGGVEVRATSQASAQPAEPRIEPPREGPAMNQPPGPLAEQPAGGDPDERFSFHRVKDDLLRLDQRTGEVSQCSWSATGWSCAAVPDERTALDSEIGRLQRENAALKKLLLSNNLELPNRLRPQASAAKGDSATANAPETSKGPAQSKQADLNRAIAFMKDVWRRLVEMMADLQRDIQRKS